MNQFCPRKALKTHTHNTNPRFAQCIQVKSERQSSSGGRVVLRSEVPVPGLGLTPPPRNTHCSLSLEPQCSLGLHWARFKEPRMLLGEGKGPEQNHTVWMGGSCSQKAGLPHLCGQNSFQQALEVDWMSVRGPQDGPAAQSVKRREVHSVLG